MIYYSKLASLKHTLIVTVTAILTGYYNRLFKVIDNLDLLAITGVEHRSFLRLRRAPLYIRNFVKRERKIVERSKKIKFIILNDYDWSKPNYGSTKSIHSNFRRLCYPSFLSDLKTNWRYRYLVFFDKKCHKSLQQSNFPVFINNKIFMLTGLLSL